MIPVPLPESLPPMDEMRILSPTAILGYGFPEASFAEGMRRNPHVIAVDAGSSDPGPYYLGSGISFTARSAVKRDLQIILAAALARKIPVVIGSAGGAGADPHLQWTADIVREIAREASLSFRMALINADIGKDVVLHALARGEIAPCGAAPPLGEESVLNSTHIVAQLGIEPIVRALELKCDVVIAGRAYDPSVFAALPVMHGFDMGLSLHLGKILECAAIACTPGSGSDCMLGVLRRDSFDLHPLNPQRRCTVASVAAHSLYEKSDPTCLPGPGGVLNLTDTEFEQLDERTVRVRGSKLIPTPYSIKLEGARRIGHRIVAIAGVRDPRFITQVDDIIQAVRDRVRENLVAGARNEYHLSFRLYGRDAVLGPVEPERHATPHELGIIIEAVAPTVELASAVCASARSTLLHFGYPGRISTAGNLAFPYSPSDLDAGEVYEFSIYHLMRVDDPNRFFPLSITEIGDAREGTS